MSYLIIKLMVWTFYIFFHHCVNLNTLQVNSCSQIAAHNTLKILFVCNNTFKYILCITRDRRLLYTWLFTMCRAAVK